MEGKKETGSPVSPSVVEERERGGRFEYFGWVYHISVNSIGHECCHLRFLFIRGKHVEMYKRDPHDNPTAKPIRRGIAGYTLVVEELGRRKVSGSDVYVLRFYSRLDDTKKGEIACASAGEIRKWMEAFDHAKQQAAFELSRTGSARNKLNLETEINLDAHRPRVRRYANGLKNLIRIGQGPESLSRQSTSNIATSIGPDQYAQGNEVDVVEAHEWKCVRTINGVRILEDVAESKSKNILVKAVGIIDASADTVFEVFLNNDRRQRYEWDMLTGDLELIDSLNGHYDVLYAKYDPRYVKSRSGKRDFVFSRQWFRGQDGTYTILHFPTAHKNFPSKSGYQRTKINPSTLEIRNLPSQSGTRCLVTQMLELQSSSRGWWKSDLWSNFEKSDPYALLSQVAASTLEIRNLPSQSGTRCLVTQMLELQSSSRGWWKSDLWSNFEKSDPYALLSQVAGLQDYIHANPSLASVSATTYYHSKSCDTSSSSDLEDAAIVADEFYDAIATDYSSDEDEDKDGKSLTGGKNMKVKLKNISWAIASMTLKRASAPDLNKELDPTVRPIVLDPSNYCGTLRQGNSDSDSDCWTCPSGEGFMIRGKTYLKDSCKVMGGEPLLKLIGADWLKVYSFASNIALHPKSLVQSEAGKKLPFILVVNLGIPARPNYSLVMYYAADRPVNEDSSLGKFVNGSDMFRDSRLKLIPRIVEGYWMVKRAVGSKACLLGKAVTCKYLRQDNFLEIDVDVGSSSVARSVISLVLGYVTSIVVDIAILIEGREEAELPEYLLGMIRLNRMKVESAVQLED